MRSTIEIQQGGSWYHPKKINHQTQKYHQGGPEQTPPGSTTKEDRQHPQRRTTKEDRHQGAALTTPRKEDHQRRTPPRRTTNTLKEGPPRNTTTKDDYHQNQGRTPPRRTTTKHHQGSTTKGDSQHPREDHQHHQGRTPRRTTKRTNTTKKYHQGGPLRNSFQWVYWPVKTDSWPYRICARHPNRRLPAATSLSLLAAPVSPRGQKTSVQPKPWRCSDLTCNNCKYVAKKKARHRHILLGQAHEAFKPYGFASAIKM